MEENAEAVQATEAVGVGQRFDPADRPAPEDWCPEHPFVARLIDSLTEAAKTTSSNGEAALVTFFVERARNEGSLPDHNGRVSMSAIAKLCGRSPFDAGRTRTRRLFDHFKVAFWLDRDVPATDDDATLPLTLRIDRYVRRMAAGGGGLPRIARTKFINLGKVADELGVERFKLQSDSAGAKRLRRALKTGEIGLRENGSKEVPTELTPDQEERLADLKAVVGTMDQAGRRVPESTRRRRSPDFEYIADMTGKPGPTMQDHLPYNRYVMEVARRRGTMLPGLMSSLDTLAMVLDHGQETIEREQKQKGSATWKAASANFASALKRFVNFLNLDLADEAGDAFGHQFESALARAVAEFENPGSAKNFERSIRRAQSLRQERLGARDLPEGFVEALRFLMDRKNLSAPALATDAGVPVHRIRAWSLGKAHPSEAALEFVAKLETYFGLSRGELASRVPRQRRRTIPKAQWSREYAELSQDARVRLPSSAAVWTPEQLKKAVALIQPLLAGGSEFGSMLQHAAHDDYRYPSIDPTDRLQDDIDAFVDYKLSTTTALLRARGAQWKDETANMRRPMLMQLLRFACSPVTDKPGTGLGLESVNATLAWFAVPDLVLAFVAARAARFADLETVDGKRGLVWSKTEQQIVRLAAMMTHPENGWLTQQTKFAAELAPILVKPEGHQLQLLDRAVAPNRFILTDADVSAARFDWRAWCSQAHRKLVQADEYLGPRIDVIRNPFEPIDGLIRSDKPMAEFIARLIAYREDWASETTNETYYMQDVRNAVMMWIHAITAFRPSNLYDLTYRDDQKGKIRKVDDKWVIEVPFDQFKNFKNSDIFGPSTNRQNYKITLKDEASLYELLDLYFFDVRPRFRNSARIDAAFISRNGTRISNTSYRHALERFGRDYLEWNPVKNTGIPGVTGFYPYCFRHLRASDILRNSKSDRPYEEASRALQTSVDMIREHYGFLLPEAVHANAADTFSASIMSALKMDRERRG